MHEDVPGLADPVAAVGGLHLQSRVPVQVQQEDVVGPSEVEPHPPCLQRQQHHLHRERHNTSWITLQMSIDIIYTLLILSQCSLWLHYCGIFVGCIELAHKILPLHWSHSAQQKNNI